MLSARAWESDDGTIKVVQNCYDQVRVHNYELGWHSIEESAELYAVRNGLPELTDIFRIQRLLFAAWDGVP